MLGFSPRFRVFGYPNPSLIPGSFKRHGVPQEILDTLKIMMTEAEAQDSQNTLLATNVLKFFNGLAPPLTKELGPWLSRNLTEKQIFDELKKLCIDGKIILYLGRHRS